MNYWLFTIPLISAFIGWFIFWIGIKMLFHPIKAIHFFGLKIQGAFPKRQEQLAEKLGKLVSTEIFSFKEITEKLTQEKNIEKLLPLADEHIDQFLKVKLKETMPMVSMFIGEKTIQQLKAVFMEELKLLFPSLIGNYITHLQQDLDIEKIIKEKVGAISSIKLEAMILQMMSKELRLLQIAGAVLGFVIGFIQLLITQLAA